MFVIGLGFLLIFVFIWYAGPLFAFGPYRPLETSTARLIALGAVVGCWLVVRLMKRLRAYRASDRLMAAVAAQPQPEPARPPAEVVKLRERFDEAVEALKQQRRDGHSLYDLPWYVIIGAPGSGKTTALLNSGLKFPLSQRVGKGAFRGVGGTRNCDWWFTDEAIFLDTAGRYTTQDSDQSSDSVGWSEFLALLRKFRARRPVNGVILTINAQDLIMQGAAARELHVEAARSRLEELNRELRIQLPVYLMVTKCDLVDGFAEYFDDLDATGRAQVWGVTFPYEQSLDNESPRAFPAEFDAILARLNERVFHRIEEVRDTRRRTKVFAFPQQMATVRDTLTEFVTEIFDNRQFSGQILLRGVHFTSGTQEGTPIDRLLGSISRQFGAAAAVVPSSGAGKAYFVETLLKDVMIGESGLAGVNRRLEARKAAAQLGAYAATGLVAAAGVAVLSVSYSRNREFLEEIETDIAAFEKAPRVTPESPPDRIVTRLDAIRAIVDTSDRYRSNTTWAMSWGLYEGASIGNAARRAYQRELDGTLLPLVGARLGQRVTQHASEPEKLYHYFKAYFMLNQPEHLDKEFLKPVVEQEWSATGGALAPALTAHFQSLLDNSDTLRQIPVDNKLVAQARSSLRQTSMPRILYEGVKRAHSDAEGLRIDQVAGLEVERVFRRRSGTPLSTPMRRLYTRDAFKEVIREVQVEPLKQLAQDAWLWGDDLTSSAANARTFVSGMITLYEQDYIRAWDTFLDDLEFVFPPTVPATRDALRILTSSTSPLEGILRVVRDHTTLVETKAASPQGGIIGDAQKKIGAILKPLQQVAGLPTTDPGKIVTAQFQWVRQLLAGEAGKTQLDAIIATLSEIQQQLDTMGPDVSGARAAEILGSPVFRGLMQRLREQAGALPPGLRTLVSEIAEAPGESVIADATNEIEQAYERQVQPMCRDLIANRYPFSGQAQPEVKLDDFGAVFGYGGVFDKFFTEHLAKQVDTSQSPWTWRPGSVSPRRKLLAQFEAAQRLREMFFPAGTNAPKVEFALTMTELDPGATRFILQIDGQNLDVRRQQGATRSAVVWPGSPPGNVTATFEGQRYYDPPKSYAGAWAWFRMIDETAQGPADAQQRIRLTVQNPHHRVNVVVEAERAQKSPFADRSWRQFSCES
jgi:type VI secretion system protein ImpL